MVEKMKTEGDFTNLDGWNSKGKKNFSCNNNISGGEELEGPLEDS